MSNHTKINLSKNYIKHIFGIMLILSLVLFSACLGMRTHVKGIEPSARPLNTGKYEIIEPAEFAVSSFKLFWIFPVTPDLKIHETIEEAVNNRGGDNLIEMQVWHERQYWIVGIVDIIHVKGIVIRTAD